MYALRPGEYVLKFLKIMRLGIYLVLLTTFTVSANGFSQKVKVTLNLEQRSILEIIKELRKVSDYQFLYRVDELRKCGKRDLKVQDAGVEEVMRQLLDGTHLTWRLDDDVILIKTAPKTAAPAVPQKVRTVQGVVSDTKGGKLPGVTVILKGTTLGGVTDAEGNFKFEIPDQKDMILVFSFVGMKKQEVKYTGQENLHIVLEDDIAEMEEVVVNGIFTRKKESFTGSTTTFTSKELKMVGNQSVLQSLKTLDPSFAIIENNEFGSDPNHLPNIEIRGKSSIVGLTDEYETDPNQPLFILDGFESDLETINDLSMDRVQSITVLKDAAATAIYGSKAANGVVVVETKLPAMGSLRVNYNGNLQLTFADLSDYNLMNAEEKLEYEVRSGLYEKSSKPGWTDDKLDAYNRILKLVKEGNDVDWLSIPVRELGVGHKHTVMAEGGNESFRYAFDLFYSNKVGVMKGSKRDNYGGGIRLQYNLKNLKFSNYASFDHLKSVNSPYGSFSSYLYYNPYYNPYDENGNVKKVLYSYEYYDRGITSKTMYNELYNAVLPSKNQQTSNNFLNNFSIEYDIIQGLKLKANLSLSVDNGKTDVYKSYENTEFLDKEKKGSYAQSTSNDFSYDINVILSYFKSLKKHFINLGFVYNLQEKQYDNTSIYVVGFPNANMDHVSIGSGYQEGAKPGGARSISHG